MKLIIFSGAGDPNHLKYKPVYENIIDEALTRGYNDILLQGWCGQKSYHQEGFLSYNTAVVKTKQVLLEAETSNVPYDVICRSFGCSTLLKAVSEIKPKLLRNATLWGPPLFTSFELFKRNLENTIIEGFSKGTYLDKNLYEELFPIEVLIREFSQNFKLRIAYGTKDPYCTESFAFFLKNSFPNENISYHSVIGAIHEVKEKNQEYFNALFY